MQEEIGTVIKERNRTASISIPREDNCNGCKHCLRDQKGNNMLTFADNQIRAKSGDKVVLTSKKINQVTDGFLLFILPLILFPVGYFIGIISGVEIIGLITGLGFSSIPFIYLKFNSKKYGMRIVKIIADTYVSENKI